MVTVAVDAMGGDNAPRTEVDGAVAAVKSYDVKVILVGREEMLREEPLDISLLSSLRSRRLTATFTSKHVRDWPQD